MHLLPRPLADAGAAVAVVDHVTKARDGRGRWGRGSGAKLGEADAGFSLEVTQPFARGHPGEAVLRVAKDRYGVIGPEGSVAATVAFTVNVAGHLRIVLHPAQASAEPWNGPTECMAVVLDVLTALAGAEVSGNALVRDVKAHGHAFHERTIREAADRLVLSPEHPVYVRTGARNARLYRFDRGAQRLGDLPEKDEFE